jgi:hypothetical protein
MIHSYILGSSETFEIFDDSRSYRYPEDFELFHTSNKLRIYRDHGDTNPYEILNKDSNISNLDISYFKSSSYSIDSISIYYPNENSNINIKDLYY